MIRTARKCFDILNHSEGYIDGTNISELEDARENFWRMISKYRFHVPKSVPGAHLEHISLFPCFKGWLMSFQSTILFAKERYLQENGTFVPKLATVMSNADSVERCNSLGKSMGRKPGI